MCVRRAIGLAAEGYPLNVQSAWTGAEKPSIDRTTEPVADPFASNVSSPPRWCPPGGSPDQVAPVHSTLSTSSTDVSARSTTSSSEWVFISTRKTAAATFLYGYRLPFMLVGVGLNAIAISIAIRRLRTIPAAREEVEHPCALDGSAR